MSRREKTDFILQQVALCIEKGDWIQATILSRKISTKYFTRKPKRTPEQQEADKKAREEAEKNRSADDPPIGEAQQPAEAPSTNGHTKPDDDRPLAEKLHFHLNDVWSSCQDQNNWPHLSGDPKVELRGAMTKFGYLRDLLPQLATLKQAVH